MFKSLFHENQLIGPQKYTFAESKSSQNASIFHEKNYGWVKFFIGYPYTAGYRGIQEYCCLSKIPEIWILNLHQQKYEVMQVAPLITYSEYKLRLVIPIFFHPRFILFYFPTSKLYYTKSGRVMCEGKCNLKLRQQATNLSCLTF